MNLIVDGNSLFAKWFFGFGNGLYGFYNGLASLIGKYNPDEVHIAFDSPRNWRKGLWPEYKAGRPEKPDGWYDQLSHLKTALAQSNHAIYEVDGYEGDDIIAGLVAVLQPCVIFSEDKDVFQLIAPQVSVDRGNTLWTVSTFESVYGIEPWQFPHLQSLMGDEVDNIPGVNGFGPKRSILLLKERTTLDGVYNDLPNGVWGQKLVLDKERAYLSLELATLKAPKLDITLGFYSLEELRKRL